MGRIEVEEDLLARREALRTDSPIS